MKQQDRFRRSTTTGYVGAPGNWTGTPRTFTDRWSAIHQEEQNRLPTGIIVGSLLGAAAWLSLVLLVLSW